MLILISSKVGRVRVHAHELGCLQVYLRHNECGHARLCRDLVYGQVRHALDMVQSIVYDSGSTTLNNAPAAVLLLAQNEINFVKSLRQLEVGQTTGWKPISKGVSFSMPLKC